MASKSEFDTIERGAYSCRMNKPSSRSKSLPSVKAAKAVGAGKTPASVARGKPAAPAAKATTLRLSPALQLGLEMLQGVLKKPINKMVNEAVEGFIAKRSVEIESDLNAVLAQIKAYRRADPNFETAIAEFVDAEARLGAADPAEGIALVGKPAVGPTQTRVRELLSH
jgi:predicted transcriptional regulator